MPLRDLFLDVAVILLMATAVMFVLVRRSSG
jgi:hypothetical protein